LNDNHQMFEGCDKLINKPTIEKKKKGIFQNLFK